MADLTYKKAVKSFLNRNFNRNFFSFHRKPATRSGIELPHQRSSVLHRTARGANHRQQLQSLRNNPKASIPRWTESIQQKTGTRHHLPNPAWFSRRDPSGCRPFPDHSQGLIPSNDRRISRQSAEPIQHGRAGLLLERARLVRHAGGRRLAQVPNLLPNAGRGAKNRTTDGDLFTALLPVQSGHCGSAELSGHHFCARFCHHHAEHGPAHAESESGTSNAHR